MRVVAIAIAKSFMFHDHHVTCPVASIRTPPKISTVTITHLLPPSVDKLASLLSYVLFMKRSRLMVLERRKRSP
ncbi:hypothetical protein A2U01_0078374, partial [Trifolium medium]|nr:hypothetical protein [Trifolium medium]